MKITVRTSARVRVYSADANLPADGFLPSTDAVKIRPCGQWSASAQTHSFPPSPPLPSPPLPCERSLLSAQMGCVCTDADARKKYKNKNKNKNIFLFFYFFLFFLFFLFFYFLGVIAGLKREKKISVSGFQSPRSPRSGGFEGESTRRRRFFRPSSPSHPSKLYSSLGWLNSKVPKPFPPFSLRLIDVDGF
jgi:hypothetical protein